MKHAQHPTVARFAVGWLRFRWAAGSQLPHSFACPYEQAPQVSQKYSVRDGADSYRQLQLHRYTATGFANDACQDGKVYAGRGRPFPRVCRAWNRSVLPSCLSHRGPIPSHLRGRLRLGKHLVPRVSSRRTGLRIGDRCVLPGPAVRPCKANASSGHWWKSIILAGRQSPPGNMYR